MDDIVSSILGTGNSCPKCGEEMVRCGSIEKKGKKRKVWRCPKCQHRIIE
jgi:predicted RNA-binding Zn-ribbon protein involved in translation (DUF1610 family)